MLTVPLCRPQQSADGFHQGLLTVAGHTDDAQDLALPQLQIDVMRDRCRPDPRFAIQSGGTRSASFYLQHNLTTDHLQGQIRFGFTSPAAISSTTAPLRRMAMSSARAMTSSSL